MSGLLSRGRGLSSCTSCRAGTAVVPADVQHSGSFLVRQNVFTIFSSGLVY